MTTVWPKEHAHVASYLTDAAVKVTEVVVGVLLGTWYGREITMNINTELIFTIYTYSQTS